MSNVRQSRQKAYYDPAKNPRPARPVAGRVAKKAGRSGKHAVRAKLCEKFGVPNTARQWIKLRKMLRSQGVQL